MKKQSTGESIKIGKIGKIGKKEERGYSSMITSNGIPWLFKNLGYKLTKPREEILNVVYLAKKPIVLDEIRSKLPKLDRVTLYRTLEYFVKCKLILKVDMKKKSPFYEMNDMHHHYII